MADDTQQPKLDPNFDYAKLPDGSYAKFKKGTSRVEIEGRLTAAGLLPKPKAAAQPTSVGGMSPYKTEAMRKRAETTAKQGIGEVMPGGHTPAFGGHMPAYGFTPSNVADITAYGIKSAATGTKDIVKDLATNPNWAATMPAGARPSTMQKFVTEPAKQQIGEAKKAYGEGRYSEAFGHGLAGVVPLVGPFAAHLGERAGKGDVGGAIGEAVGTTLALKAGKDVSGMVVDKATGMISPESLRVRAAKLNTKVLRTGDPIARDYGMSKGLQVAKEGIIATLKDLPQKIEVKRSAKAAQVQSLAQQLDKAGTTVDISQEVKPIVGDVIKVANQRGLLTPQLRNAIGGLVKRVTTQTDMQTGQIIARDLTKLKVSDALALQKGLEDMSAFGKNAPEAINNLARRLRGVIGDKLNATSPEMQRLRGEESKLITARDAARDNYAKSLNDNRTLARGFIYSTMGAAAGYVMLKMAGIGFGPAIAGILILRTLAESTPSRTARAAFYAKSADLVDASLGRNPQVWRQMFGAQPQPPIGGGPAPTAPQGAPMGGPAPQGGSPPQVPAPAQLAAAIGTPQAAAVASAPTPSVAPTGAVPPAAPAAMSADMVDPRVKAPDVKGEASQAEIKFLKEKLMNASPDDRLGVLKQLQDAEARAAGVKAPAAGEVKDISKMGRKAAADAAAKPAAVNVAESNTKAKAMMDRMDALLERLEKPKSGADRVAIEREVKEIKQLLSGEAKGADATRIKKRIADRERLAGKRSTEKTLEPEAAAAATTGGSTSMAQSPEQVMLDREAAKTASSVQLLQMGYAKLASYEGGPEMVKAMQKMAKDLAAQPDYNELEALAQALNAMKEVNGGK